MRISLAGLIVLSACGGSGDSGSLSCEYLAGDNCWKTTATMATSCLPATTEHGVLAADNGSCTFASGAIVTFSPALELPLPQQYKGWNFTVTNGGQTCMMFKDSSRGFELTVNDETVSESLVGTMGLSLSCPDGETYENSNALDLLQCDEDLGDLPGTTWSSSATSVRFGLLSTGIDDFTVFDCQR